MATNGNRAYVIGVGMTKFERCDRDYRDLGQEAGRAALEDAGIGYDQVQEAYAGFVNLQSCAGQFVVYGLGMTGVPVYNVNNNCSTGSTALYLAQNAVRHGQADVVLAIGFEKMQKGPLEGQLKGLEQMREERQREKKPPIAAQIFGDAGRQHMEQYGTRKETFAKIAEKNHRHAVHNPRAQYRDAYSLQEILDSRMIYDPLTLLQCCPTTDGAAAAVVVSEEYLRKHPDERAVEIKAMAITTDRAEDFARDAIGRVGFGMTDRAARKVYEATGIGPDDVDVVELHDCFSTNELVTYEGLGLCAEGEGEKLVLDDATTYGGRWVVNPSGGLLSKGHPLGATGLGQCAELVWQVRGEAGGRQVEGARIALQHNIGLGGAAVVGMYAKP